MTPERLVPGPAPVGGVQASVGYAAFWLLCVAFLICPPWAQASAGLSRFVLLSGAASLFLAWPTRASLGRSSGSLLGFAPLLCLALALDLQAGLPVERAVPLAVHASFLCLVCSVLGAGLAGSRAAWQALVFGAWFLLPMAIGIWSHVASHTGWSTQGILMWSPVASWWLELPLLRESPPGLDLGRNGCLLVGLGLWLAARRLVAPRPEDGVRA